MIYFCSQCGESSDDEICAECGKICEELKTGLKRKKTMVNIDEELSEFDRELKNTNRLYHSMFGEYFHIRGK